MHLGEEVALPAETRQPAQHNRSEWNSNIRISRDEIGTFLGAFFSLFPFSPLSRPWEVGRPLGGVHQGFELCIFRVVNRFPFPTVIERV